MKLLDESLIPKKIKKMRLDRFMTQEKLAQTIGVSKGYISRIENSRSAPPVGMLISLALSFEVNVNSFFETEDRETYVTVTPKDNRPVIARDHMTDARYEHLAINFPKRSFEPFIIKALPANEKTQVNQHPGQEFILVLKGNIEININGNNYHLMEGDSIFFDSTYPHNGSCSSEEGAELFCIITSNSLNHDIQSGKRFKAD